MEGTGSSSRGLRQIRKLGMLLWLIPLLVVALVLAWQAWSTQQQRAAIHAEAEALLVLLDNSARVTTEEYGAWKALGAAHPDVRSEAAALFDNPRFAPVLVSSQELVARSLVGVDTDGAVSRRLVEERICTPLAEAPATANDDVPLYLVPWLNPVALDSLPCAHVLTSRLLAADPGAFAEGAALLALVLAALPPDDARPFIDELVARIATADAGNVDLLFGALRGLHSTVFPDEFSTALATLTARIANAPGPREIASLFDAIDFAKYSATPAELEPVLNAAIAQMLARNDGDLTRDIYFTLTDLKVTHPDTSFGYRPDYLMKGINVYSDALEIYDYSRILALDDRFAGQDAALAFALLDGIRALHDASYLSSIVPYCRRFIEASTALEYADFLGGAQLLIEQLGNNRFIFQRPCLLDSGLVARIAPEDRGAMSAVVLDALPTMSGRGAADRIAEGIELLGQLDVELDGAQVQRLATLVTETVTAQPNSRISGKLVRAATVADVPFPPEFYTELFVLTVDTTQTSGPGLFVPPGLLEKLPADQRAYIASAALATFTSAVAAMDDAEAIATQAQLLLALKPWLAEAEIAQLGNGLETAMQDARSIPVFARLARTLLALKPQLRTQVAPLHSAWLRHVAASNTRAELAELFEASGTLGAVSTANAEGRATVRAAAVRFMEQIVAEDAHANSVRDILMKPPVESTEAQVQGWNERVRRTMQRAASGPRVMLEAADIAQLSARYRHALTEERVSLPFSDYAMSLETMAQFSRPGELDTLLVALRQRLDASGDPATHELLVSAWITVENATNAARTPAERMPLYQDVLGLPLTNAASRAELVAAAGRIVEAEFSDTWHLLAWMPG